MANFNDFNIDALLDLYPKLTKDTPVYSTPSVKKGIWWTKLKGELAGKIYSWVQNDEGIFMMFFLQDNYLNTKSYYILLKSDMIAWEHIKPQLDAKRRAQMTFYDRWFDEFETAIADRYNKVLESVKDTAKTGLTYGIAAFALIVLVKLKK